MPQTTCVSVDDVRQQATAANEATHIYYTVAQGLAYIVYSSSRPPTLVVYVVAYHTLVAYIAAEGLIH
jgi:hypothetical protein